MQPLERFIRVQAASGIVLLATAGCALVWANSPWGESYRAFFATRFEIAVGPWSVATSLDFLIDDVLMAMFFLVIGLEVRRELHGGSLGSLRRAALPIAGALGGMVVPAAIFVMLVGAVGDASVGWGVPISTDTAFALGVLALLGPRIAPGLRVLLLAIAIVDDLLAILIIAVFYSSGIALTGIVVAFGGIGGILILQRFGVRNVLAYVVPAVVIWFGIWRAGIHPTIAGVLVGLLTPARTWYGPEGLAAAARHHIEESERPADSGGTRLRDIARSVFELRRAHREAVSPVERVETALHVWAAFFIMPVFAFANAGIDFDQVNVAGAPRLAAGVAAGLVVGKLVGVLLACAGAVKLGIAELGRDVTWRGIAVIGAAAGIGFTMALFIANLAFAGRPELRDVAFVAVLFASAVAAGLALILGRVLLRRPAKNQPDERECP
jgi:NhaA family Na+:H+ antiporter